MAISKEYKEYISDCIVRVGNVRIRQMMGGYLVYYRNRLIGDIGDGMLLIKHTPSSDRLLEGNEQAYPYAESKTLMWVFEDPENTDFMRQLFDKMYEELPQKCERKKRLKKTEKHT